jgi:hypothetical protein
MKDIKKDRILTAVPDIPSKQTNNRTDWANDLSEELRKELEKSLIEARKGKMISHEDAMKQIKRQYKL